MLNAGQYENFLVEIASYGYVIAADGSPTGSGSPNQQSKVQDMRDSLDWAMAGKANKYGNVDTGMMTTAGHSCGGLEAMSTAYHDERVKRIMMFNIAIFQDDRRYLLQEIKVPVAWFVGGKTDMGFNTVSLLSCLMISIFLLQCADYIYPVG
jgi:dienelactone hydrolase